MRRAACALALVGLAAAAAAQDPDDGASRAERLRRRHEALLGRDAGQAARGPVVAERRRQVLARIRGALAERLAREPTRAEVEDEIERLLANARAGMDARARAEAQRAAEGGAGAAGAETAGAETAGDPAPAAGLAPPGRRDSLREEVRRQTSRAISRYLAELVRSDRLAKEERDRILGLDGHDQVFETLRLVKQQRLADADDLPPEERERLERAEPLDLLFGPERAGLVRPSSTQLTDAQRAELDALPRVEGLRRRREMLRENAARALRDQGVPAERAEELARPPREDGER